MKPHLQEECLGVSVIYLGGLNFMFNVHEKSLPIVSGIGNVLGEMEIEIITLFHNPELYLKEKDRDLKERTYIPLIPKDVDAEVDQLEDYVDKSLQYRVQIKSVHLKKQKIKKFTHFYLQYGFFKERSSTKTSLFELSNTNTIAPNAPVNIEQEFFHYVVVNDAFIRYCCNNTIVIEVMVTRQ